LVVARALFSLRRRRGGGRRGQEGHRLAREGHPRRVPRDHGLRAGQHLSDAGFLPGLSSGYARCRTTGATIDGQTRPGQARGSDFSPRAVGNINGRTARAGHSESAPIGRLPRFARKDMICGGQRVPSSQLPAPSRNSVSERPFSARKSAGRMSATRKGETPSPRRLAYTLFSLFLAPFGEERWPVAGSW